MEADYFNEAQGFSTGSTLFFSLEGAEIEGTTQWTDLEGHQNNSKIVLLDSETLERIPHHVEREALALAKQDSALMMIRPLVPLEYSRTYIVGIKDMADNNGNLVSPPTGFELLRSGSRRELRSSR